MSLKDKLNNYFLGRNAKLEYDLLRDLVDEFYSDIVIVDKKLLKDIAALEAGEYVTSRFFPNILTGLSLIYFAFSQDVIMTSFSVGISEGVRNGLGLYYKKTRRGLMKEVGDAIKEKNYLQKEIDNYNNEIEKSIKEIKDLNEEIKKLEEERKSDEGFGFDSSGYDGWLKPDD